MLVLVALAHAACPAPDDAWVDGIVGRMLDSAERQAPLPADNPLGALLDVDLVLPPGPDALTAIGAPSTGGRTGDLAPGFGDVTWTEDGWHLYTWPQVEFTLSADGGRGEFVEAGADARYVRLCDALPETFRAADARGHLVQQMSEAADRLSAEREAEKEAAANAPKPPPPKERNPFRVGATVRYDAAVGDAAKTLHGSAWGGGAWIERAVGPLLVTHVDLRVDKVVGLPVEWNGVAGQLDASSYRFSPEVRGRLELGPLEATAGGGPSFALFRATLATTVDPHEAGELMGGLHVGADVSLRPKGMPVSVLVSLGAEGHLHRSAPLEPVVQAGAAVGLAFGGLRKRTETPDAPPR